MKKLLNSKPFFLLWAGPFSLRSNLSSNGLSPGCIITHLTGLRGRDSSTNPFPPTSFSPRRQNYAKRLLSPQAPSLKPSATDPEVFAPEFNLKSYDGEYQNTQSRPINWLGHQEGGGGGLWGSGRRGWGSDKQREECWQLCRVSGCRRRRCRFNQRRRQVSWLAR